MIGLQDLKERLLRLDEDAYLLDDENVYSCFIVGGGALILMGYIIRATHDIDVICFFPKNLLSLMDKYDMNASACAYMDSFPDDYIKRAKRLI